jgi:ribonuclease HI
MDDAVEYAAPAPTPPYRWRDAYLTALFETDRGRVYSRIMEAERALLRREHELFTDTNGRAEQEAVSNALHALRSLRNCLGLVNADVAA